MKSSVISLFSAAVTLGFIHGIEPGHGWPVAASSALNRPRKWLWGLAASVLLGVGHLISSIAVVVLFFLVKNYFNLHTLNDPVVLPGGIEIGGLIGVIAGLLLIGLGIWEYASGHGHDHHGPGNDHNHDHEHDASGDVRESVHEHGPHDHPDDPIEKRSLWGIATFAFLLGFIHEEEFEIIALCAGSELCLELMLAYALTVIAAIVGMTMLLLAGFHHFEERVHRLEPYLPRISALILMIMGVGFITGYF